jgi:hypothetical protein
MLRSLGPVAPAAGRQPRRPRSSDDEVVRTVSLMWGVDMQVTEGGSSGSPIFDSQVSIFHDQSRSSD